MDIPVTFKEVEINGRKFILNKMDARTGSFMLFKLMKILTPIFKSIKVDKLEEMKLEDLNLSDLASSLFDLPEKEFRYIQDNCLQVVNVMLPAGPRQLLTKHGEWGISGIEFDTSLIMNLTIQSLIFNVQGFFKESLLTSLMEKLNTSQLN